MAEDTLRSVSLRRASAGTFVATNVRGGELTFGGADDQFSPVELLLVAIAGCTAMDVDVDRKSTRQNSSHYRESRMPSSA